MNAGAYGREMKDIVFTTTYMDYEGNIHTINLEEHKFEYRKSIFSENAYVIIETVLKLEKGKKNEIRDTMQEYKNQRKEKQPLDKASAGSTFKRGKDFITAQLIDELGLKGTKIGGAEVSTKHAGFIINNGNATSKDILDLIAYVEKRVYEKTGKAIELEVQVIGE